MYWQQYTEGGGSISLLICCLVTSRSTELMPAVVQNCVIFTDSAVFVEAT